MIVRLTLKVTDIYDAGDYLVLVTTDRQSAFDRILASIPFKGQVHNFKRTDKKLNCYDFGEKRWIHIVWLRLMSGLRQVLNETSLWWFNKTQHIVPNAVVSAPDKNVTIAKKCSVFPVEFVGEILFMKIVKS